MYVCRYTISCFDGLVLVLCKLASVLIQTFVSAYSALQFLAIASLIILRFVLHKQSQIAYRSLCIYVSL
ncbi:hypothetical protein GGR51DRAFT_540372 [Nemania sp. FL0031]|nr:hypothetical protein GGR51DRAFT_540372 [Nemania sp. FL0031]